MKLQFKIQQYQTDAVDSTVDIFNGQPNQGLLEYKFCRGKVFVIDNGRRIEQKSFDFSGSDTGYCNSEVQLSEEELLKNIHQIQTQNNIHLSSEVIKRLGACQLDVEMETGTGKTYVYIKTMFELNKRYGWTKFIVVVPSIAIREGVKKSFDIMQDHFMEQYGKKARYFVYNSDNLNQIDAYAQSADISVMIINTQAFNTSLNEKKAKSNKTARIIYDKRDEFGSRRPIDVIAANRPIIILDEPQKMGGAATQTALARFKPLFTLNYSATHRETHNPVYVLDALDAYNQKLVKKIEVVGFELRNLKGTESYIYFDSVLLSKNEPPKVRLEMECRSKSGNIKRVYKKLGEGDNLYSISGDMEQYRGYVLTEIDPVRGRAIFGNGVTLGVKDIQGNITADHKARIQIRETIKAHFRKEASLFKRGIKCLSLFFIDEVANYRQYDEDGNQMLGRYGEIFEQEYVAELNNNQNMFVPDYMSYLGSISAHATHTGYFSIDKKGHAVNSTTKHGSDQSDDTSAYDLILKNKERLLSLDEPVRFIFSHSALREGWDNPNVFQICSLRQSNSVAQKRQEVGRGLRLCVDNHGVRQDSDALPEEVHKVNRLTVIASEGYATFVADLQRDILQDLYDRPTKADVDFFTGKIVTLNNGTKRTLTAGDAQKIYFQLGMKGYITEDGEVTETFRRACAAESLLPLNGELQPMTDAIMKLVQSIYDPSVLKNMIVDGSKTTTPENKLNDNFMKKEFQELWRRINHKYAYTVSFDSEELIEKAVAAIDRELSVTQLSYVVTRGEQKDTASLNDLKHGNIMRQQQTATEKLRTDIVSNVRYDLLGKISRVTRLTRKTVAMILSKIHPSKFAMFKANPEEFIRKTTRLIMEQKATIIVEHISYNRLEGTFDSDIFTQEKHGTIDRAFEGRKSIVDYVFTDSEGEREFVGQIDTAKEVAVYAKLPKGFHIPTPVGNYSPDWAIAFQEGEVKHIYFVAETKGSMSSMDLREIEKSKISCAEKLFEQISTSNVKYSKIDSFETLMDVVK